MGLIDLYRLSDNRLTLVSLRTGRPNLSMGAGPGDAGDHFLYTSAQIDVFRDRMSGAGPYFATGDAGHGGQYSPGDGQRAITNANAFLANPSQSYWACPVPIYTNSPWPGESGNPGYFSRPMRAAWCAMTLPNHNNAPAWRQQTKELLLWTAQHPNHNFANNSHYPLNFHGSAQSPIFGLAGWLLRLFKARDMLGRDTFTSAENQSLDDWMYRWSNYIFRWLHQTVIQAKIPNRLTFNFATNHVNMGGYREVGRLWDGGPFPSVASVYDHTNRHAACAGSAAFAANYLKRYGVQPSPGGVQPSYGWFTVDELLLHAKVYAAEFVHFSTYASGATGDFHRHWNDNGAFARSGWTYASNEILGPLEIAKWFAVRGDDSVWSYSTTGGHFGSEGSPNDTPGVSGFPAKNLHYAQWTHARYANTGTSSWQRTINGVAHYPQVTGYGHFHDAIPSALVAQRYPTDPILESSYKRSGNGFPPYPQQYYPQGVWDSREGPMATYIGLIELAGV
jgi:hypothetical protein